MGEYQTIDVTFSGVTIQFKDNTGYESRNNSTIRMIQDAYTKYPPSKNVSGHYRIYTGDIYSSSCAFSYAATSSKNAEKSLPHFLFDAWTEIGVADYDATFQAMIDAGNQPWKDKRVFWIGANTNQLRVSCQKLTREHPDEIDFRLMAWNRAEPNALHKNTASYVSLTDHCDYRVLVDLSAAGFSARLPLLLASGRPVILADRNHEAWFYWDGTLQPWVHYIPGGSTPDSIYTACKWTFENPEKAEEIGRCGREYAKTYLTHEAAVKRCAELLWKYGKNTITYIILTCENYLPTRGQAMLDTWLQNVDEYYFLSAKADITKRVLGWNTPDDYQSCSKKYIEFFRNVDIQSDWIVFVDDDTFVFPQRMKNMLSTKNPNDPLYIGYEFPNPTDHGGMSGGAGFVLSKNTYTQLRNYLRTTEDVWISMYTDVSMATWLLARLSGIQKIIDYRFHPFQCNSDLEFRDALTFHYVNPYTMVEYYQRMMNLCES